MSSYFDKQGAAFKRNVQSASTRITSKTLEPPASAPSPVPSHSSNTSKNENKDKDTKRKRETPKDPKEVYSQPTVTGYGSEAFTQVTFVIEFLKKKDEPKTFLEILQYLSQVHIKDEQKKVIFNILRMHPRVTFEKDAKSKAWDAGTFKHNPILPVRNKNDLIGYLQKKADAQGVTAKDLKDGWPDCEDGINELEKEHKLLVARTKKDNHVRSVWSDDPTLFHKVDPEFQTMWRQVDLPSVDDTVRRLLEAGQKPASEDPSKRVKAPPKPKDKKRKAPRKNGRQTNTHMEHLLKDYSHLKR